MLSSVIYCSFLVKMCLTNVVLCLCIHFHWAFLLFLNVCSLLSEMCSVFCLVRVYGVLIFVLCMFSCAMYCENCLLVLLIVRLCCACLL